MANDKLSREGHRQRMRNAYLADYMENAPDHNVLELFLSVIIPRKDVKEVSYNLLNRFKTLDGVISASPKTLMEVDGVGASTAIELSLISIIAKRAEISRNNSVEALNNTDEAIEYLSNFLKREKSEKLYMVTLRSNNTIINTHLISTGIANTVNADIQLIVSNAINDKASSVILAHNHPSFNANPSAEDISFTINIKNVLEKMNIFLADHVIITGDSGISVLNIMKKFKYK